MRLYVDKEADALYLRLDESTILSSLRRYRRVSCSTTTSPMKLLGSQLLYLSKRSSELGLSALQFDTS